MTLYMWVNVRKFGTPDAVRHIARTQRLNKHTVRLHWHSEQVYEAHEWRKPHPLDICSSRTSLCHAFIMHFLELPLCLWPFLRHFFHIGFPLLQSTLSPVHFFLLFMSLWKGIFICNFNTLSPIIPSLQLPLHHEL